ncbi:hypothetical protein CNBG_9583 [Cryptococcus deuterogattii R265]|uniref:uncharacterized protein n=1 Tax=Cryptococcus deuterogattii (strain R265) TaxID=294750 RepID=UPI0005B5CEC6|nr:hypothetical protein I310_02361 [Cryptococcus deuterogattii CA1014]KNX49805.2 hypothetical protein CNBG_9583 [Cryptococcus deuterogattii R265]
MFPPESIWNDQEQLVSYYVNNAVPIRTQPGVLIASIIVSILGSYATLIVLGRRTSSRGWRNHLLLLLAAIVFAACAIWGMHFVSMISIRLKASPDVVWYIRFNDGMTAMSLLVPMVATALSFWVIGSELEFSIWRVLLAGGIMGLTVGLMHYSASFKLPYLTVSYTAVTVVFALILAVVAATVALFLFFRLRTQWQDSWWKRGLCALMLATAVCGMHYLGLGGASYYTKPKIDWRELTKSSQSVRLAIGISVMCATIVLFCFLVALFDALTRRSIRNKARSIVVASASFDKTGKLLVKNDGTIPMQVISTDADLQRVLRELDPRQPTFQWLYQLSFNWSLVTPFVPRVLKSVFDRSRGIVKRASPLERGLPHSYWETLLFRSRFIEASVLLAQQLDLSVESLGAMFDRVLTTGTRAPTPEDKSGKAVEEGKASMKGDDESSIHGITLRMHNSEGVMLFLVREIGDGHPAAWDNPSADKSQLRSVDNVDSYTARGYRLAETRYFSKAMADHFGVSKQEMDVFLSACKTYAKRGTRPVVQSGGAYLGLFGVRPTGEKSNLDVLVYNFARHQIPAYRLPDVSYPLTSTMKAWVRELSNCPMGEVLQRCNEAVLQAEKSEDGMSLHSQVDEALYEFQSALAVAIEALATALRCWPTLHQIATLSPEILEIPASDNDDKPPAEMVVLEVILPAPDARLTPVQSRASGVQAPSLASGRHESDKPPAPFVYTPFSLFTKSQAMLLRARAFQEFSKSTSMDLNKVYPLVPTDVAAELDAYDRDEKRPDSNSNPFKKLYHSSKTGNKGLIVDVGDDNGIDESYHIPLSPMGSDTTGDANEKSFSTLSPTLQSLSMNTARMGNRRGTGQSDNSATPLQAPVESMKKGLSNLVHKAAGATGYYGEEDGDEGTMQEGSIGMPVYSSVRNKTDGWFMRSMRDLERADQTGMLDGVEWQPKGRQ